MKISICSPAFIQLKNSLGVTSQSFVMCLLCELILQRQYRQYIVQQVGIQSRGIFILSYSIKRPTFRTNRRERATVKLFFIGHLGAFAMELQTTLNTVCHDSIISCTVSLYQMLSSAKPNWFAAEMKGWQTAIHHRFCCNQRCLHLYETSECVCVSLRGSEMKG